MKITICYNSTNPSDVAIFTRITEEKMQATLKKRNSSIHEFKIEFNQKDVLIEKHWVEWFSEMVNAGLSPSQVTFKPEAQKDSEAAKAFIQRMQQFSELATLAPKLQPLSEVTNIIGPRIPPVSDDPDEYLSMHVPGAPPPSPASIPVKNSPLTITNSEDSEENNHDYARKNAKLTKLKECLTALYKKSSELLNLSKQIESSPAYRIYRITLELHNKLDRNKQDYLESLNITDSDFQSLIRTTLSEPLELKIKTDASQSEQVNIKYELSQHPQWGLLSILDQILWCIDLYRLATGTRLSFLKIAQPEQMHYIEEIEEEITRYQCS